MCKPTCHWLYVCLYIPADKFPNDLILRASSFIRAVSHTCSPFPLPSFLPRSFLKCHMLNFKPEPPLQISSVVQQPWLIYVHTRARPGMGGGSSWGGGGEFTFFFVLPSPSPLRFTCRLRPLLGLLFHFYLCCISPGPALTHVCFPEGRQAVSSESKHQVKYFIFPS